MENELSTLIVKFGRKSKGESDEPEEDEIEDPSAEVKV